MKQCPFGIECENCRFYKSWILVNGRGEQKAEDRCGIELLFDEIPRIRGSVDGCQAAVNETRNRAIETKATVNGFVDGLVEMAAHKAIER
jgi:hypothetical protein